MKELKTIIENYLKHLNIAEGTATVLIFLSLLVVVVLLIYISVFFSRFLLRKIIGPVLKKMNLKWFQLLVKHKLFLVVGHLVAVIALKQAIPVLFEDWPKTLVFFDKLLDVYFIFIIARMIIVLLRSAEDNLSDSEIFTLKPLASYFQLFRILLYIIVVILSLSILVSKSPLYLLGAFGAISAVLLLIFKDTILGVVASIQISANDMVRIGDWVEMQKFNADGDVIAMNLNTVKISNWDKTISTVPTYYFITESFKNWRGMQQSGGRRIKRNILINVHSIRFVDPEMREKFKKIQLITDYVNGRQKEIEQYNADFGVNTEVLINGRRMTNVGVFRTYIERYLRNHPGINQEMSLMVRQMEPDQNGLPIQLYCFSKSVKWVEYETVQSDIFDHLFAAASFFELSIFQSPSGDDIGGIFTGKNSLK